VVKNHTWDDPGIFQVRVKAKDQYGRESDWSDSHTITIIDNLPPTAPDMEAKRIGKTGEPFELTLSSNDPETQDVYYYIDWGDGVIEYWFGPKTSGNLVIFSHNFKESGSLTITTKAKDTMDEISIESTFNVYIIKNRVKASPFVFQIFNRIFESFPILKQILSIL
jgi:hypothetical protein